MVLLRWGFSVRLARVKKGFVIGRFRRFFGIDRFVPQMVVVREHLHVRTYLRALLLVGCTRTEREKVG